MSYLKPMLKVACFCGLATVFSGALHADTRSAHFSVTTDVVTPDLPAFTATGNSMGNGVRLTRGASGFEPKVLRTQFQATQDARNEIYASPQALSNFNSWREGAFDGADIEVLRIVDGQFTSVRRDRVREGGYHASGPYGIVAGEKMIAATRYQMAWNWYNRHEVDYHYRVRAVDDKGRVSEFSAPVTLFVPRKTGKLDEKQPVTKRPEGSGQASLTAPQNLQARITSGSIGELSWDPVPGAVGYQIFASDLPFEDNKGYFIELEGQGPAIRKGDLILLRTYIIDLHSEKTFTHRVASAHQSRRQALPATIESFPKKEGAQWELRLHEEETPVEEPGDTYLHVELEHDQELPLQMYNHSGVENDFYRVLNPDHTYRIEFWARGSGKGWIDIPDLPVAGGSDALPKRIVPSAQWRKYVVDFKISKIAQSKQVGRMGIILHASGTAQIDIDNLRMYRADTPWMDLLPEDREALEASGISLLRTHGLIKTGFSTYDLTKLVGTPGPARGATLPQVLKYLEQTGINPWLQIEPHLAPEEWLGLAEYLAAPFDPETDDAEALPWAALRVSQGHKEPWIDSFDEVWFELGNETWNMLFSPWTFPDMRGEGETHQGGKYSRGKVYGMYQEYVLSILHDSPWWERMEPKLVPVIGGWGGKNYGVAAAKVSPRSRVLSHANYIGGWDSGEGPVSDDPESYASVLAFAPQTSRSAHRYLDAVADRPGPPMIVGTYEAGPGYVVNGLNGRSVTKNQSAAQELVMKSSAAGTATLDSFLMAAMAGQRVQNFFMFKRGEGWSSHSKWYKGNVPYPSWAWLELYNHVGLGDMLAVETVEVPKQDIPKIYWRKEMQNAPMAAVYASRNGDRLTVVAISREVPDIPEGNKAIMDMVVDLPVQSARSHRVYTMSGDYKSQNTLGPEAMIERQDMPLSGEPSILTIRNLGPAETQVHVFEGVQFTR